ncbi:hypothetical protein L3X38_023504 [Prunus dulcis]|uniref:RNase H type-1 domain-containing protein n=1 Tax=Prunus dulcis TaxID=3755 RepID=A0AAD4VZ48_PRUDU|nr:hypothetical protein L3X38_023504 [Prunus dulcis]
MKLVAKREGLLMMGFKGFTHFILVTDSQEAMMMLKSEMDWRSNVGNFVEDVRLLIIERTVTDVVFQPRSGNGIAHTLAQFGLMEGTHFFWEDVAPPWL